MEMATAIREIKRGLPAGRMVASIWLLDVLIGEFGTWAHAVGTRPLAEEGPGLGGVEEGAEACDFDGYVLDQWGTMAGTDELGIQVETA